MSKFMCEAEGCHQPAMVHWKLVENDVYDGIDTYSTYRCLAHPPTELEPEYEMELIHNQHDLREYDDEG